MDTFDGSTRPQWMLQALAGVALIVLGASAFLWIVFDDRLPTTMPTPAPDSLTLWAVVRVGAGAALAAGTWLLALSLVARRRPRGR
ncbi:hypothetical protein GCM10009616_37290 [Microlunatus lacustris]